MDMYCKVYVKQISHFPERNNNLAQKMDKFIWKVYSEHFCDTSEN